MGKLSGVVKRLIDMVRGRRSKPQGFELSDEVKEEILRGLGKKPTDDLHFNRGEFDEKAEGKKSDT